MQVLIVEDEEALTTLLRYNLEAEGFLVDSATRGDDAELLLAERTPDLVLLDWMLPGLSGIELCRRIRARRETERLPVIMLTARGEEGDRVRGLGTGADDYIVKPFSVPELLAGCGRCCAGPSPPMSPTGWQPAISSSTAPGTGSAAPARSSISAHRVPPARIPDAGPGRVFSREQLLDGVWGHDVYIDERTVDVHVGRLRKALNAPRQADPIRTVRGSGYAFDETFSLEA